MIKNECEIVKDIMPNYIEKNVSNETKEFVEEHIKNCTNCKKILEELKKENANEKNNDKLNDEIEVSYLKKYNRKIRVLKSIAIILVLITVILWGCIFLKHIIYKNHYEYIHNILNTTYERMSKIKEEDNYSIITKYNENSSYSFYYKDGKYKEVHNDIESWYVNYGVKTERGYDTIQFNNYNEEPQAINIIESSTGKITGEPLKQIFFLDYFLNMNILESKHLEVIENSYQGKNCYVIKYNTNNEYKEMWIDKETMYVIREINNAESEWEYNYTWTIGNVTNEDIIINDTRRNPYDSESLNRRYNEILDRLLS